LNDKKAEHCSAFFVFGISMWFDSHFHLNALAHNWYPKKVAGGLAVGVDTLDWQITQQCLLELSGDWRQAIGFHPWIVREDLPWQELETLLNDDARLAVGEIGLDGSLNRRDNMPLQWAAFIRQVDLARDDRRIMSLHLVNDEERGYGVIRKCIDCQGVVHGFTGSLQQAQRWQALGFYIGIGDRVLAQMTDKRMQMLQGLDKSFVLLETDAPYGIGKANNIVPDAVVDVGDRLAHIWDVSVDAVEQHCQQNWFRLWDK
jgi:Tat protein secretion system quality control protein TatD with DNase activity